MLKKVFEYLKWNVKYKDQKDVPDSAEAVLGAAAGGRLCARLDCWGGSDQGRSLDRDGGFLWIGSLFGEELIAWLGLPKMKARVI